MECRNCGGENDSASNYCHSCGSRLPKLFLADLPVVTGYGDFKFRRLLPGEAEEYQNAEPTVISSISARAMSTALGFPVQPSARRFHMEPGDRTLVFQLTKRGATPETLIRDQDYIIGILTMDE